MAAQNLKYQLAAAALFALLFVFIVTTTFFPASSRWKLPGTPSSLPPSTPVSGHYPFVKPSKHWTTPLPKPGNSHSKSTPDRAIVLAKLESQDASWLESSTYHFSSSWQTSLVPIDRSFGNLHLGGKRVDKGRIADAYLKWIIENYNTLPSTIVFLHGNPARDVEDPGIPAFDRAAAVASLNTTFVAQGGFANLRCVPKKGCLERFLPTRRPPDEFRTLEVAMPKVWKALFENEDMPEKLATPCCGEFVVSREQVHKRGVGEYSRFYDWLNGSSMDDDTAGLVFEYLWHVVFGKEPVYCTELAECQCGLYGRCGDKGKQVMQR